MIYRGVRDEELEQWESMECLPESWASVVGVNVQQAHDTALFRVLEWGGMEITA